MRVLIQIWLTLRSATTASEAVSECKDTFGLAPGKLNQKMTSNQGSTYDGRCISFMHWFYPKKKMWESLQIMQSCPSVKFMKFQSGFHVSISEQWLQIQSACFFLFLQSRLLLLSHSKWRGMESSWELPIVSLQQTHVYAWCAELFNRLWPIKDNQMFICQLFVQSHCSLFARPPSEHVSVAWKASPACLPCARKIVKNGQRVTWWYPTGWFIKTSFIDWSSIHIHEVPRRQATSPILDRPRKLCN